MKKNHLKIYVLIFAFLSTFSLQAQSRCLEIIKQSTGVVFGNVLGPVIGSLRGFAGGLVSGTEVTAGALGNKDGKAERTFGFLSGGLIRGGFGIPVGLVKGSRDAFKYGLSAPLSKENFSLGGDKFWNYDPFEWE